MRRPFVKALALLMAVSMAITLPAALGAPAPQDDGITSDGGPTPMVDIIDHRLINSTYTARIPIIDGVISPNEWDIAEGSSALMSEIPPSWQESGTHITGPGIQNDTDASHRFWTMYDEDYLYFLFNCSDDSIVVDSYPDQFWRDDGIEIAIDGAYDRDVDQRNETGLGYEDGDTFAVPADGSQGIAYSLSGGSDYARYWGPNKDWTSAVNQHKIDNTSYYYIVEVMIRLNTIDNPAPGTYIGLNTGQNDDDDGSTTKEGVIRWQGLDGYEVWRNETLWGDLYFRTSVTADAGFPTVINQSDTVQFDASGSRSNNPNFTISGEYVWTFMYGEELVTLNGMSPSYKFDRPGQYTVTLNVTDGTSSWDTDIVLIGVRDTEDPVADAGPDLIVDQDELITLSAVGSSDNHPDFPDSATFEWFFITDVVVRLYGMEVEFTFVEPGIYDVKLTVTDPSGINSAIDNMKIRVRDVEPPFADAGENITVDDRQLVSFDGTGSDDNVQIVTAHWEFYLDEELVNITGITQRYTFPAPGVYEVTLTVYDGDGQFDIDELTVTVLDVTSPIADAGEVLERNEDVEITLNGELSFDDVAIVSFQWRIYFDDELIDELEGKKVPYTFTEPGLYDITLRVTDEVGLFSEDTVQYGIIDVTTPVAEAGGDKTVDEKVTVPITGEESSDNVGIVSWDWTIAAELGGPTIRRTTESFDYVFSIPGVYTITLICTDREALWDSDAFTITVLDISPPEAVPPSSQTIKVGQELVFDGRASTDNVGVIKYTWNYEMAGAPFEQVEENITVAFDSKGNYTFTLTVEDEAGNIGNATFYVLVEKYKEPEEEPGFSVLIVVVAVALVAVLASGRRRR